MYLSHLFLVIPAALLWKRVGYAPLVPLLCALVVAASALLGALIAEGFSKPLSRRLRASVPPFSAG